MTEEILTHKPTRTATKYVSEAFSFLNSEDADDTNEEDVHKHSNTVQTVENVSVETNGCVHDLEDDYRKVNSETEEHRVIKSVHNGEPLVNGEINTDYKAKISDHVVVDSGTEFSIVTFVEDSDNFVHDLQEKTNKFDRDGSKLIEINPVYEVTDEIEKINEGNNVNKDHNDVEINQNDKTKDYENVKNATNEDNENGKNDKVEDHESQMKKHQDEKKEFDNPTKDCDESGVVSDPKNDNVNTINTNAGERSSVLIDGEIVELRKSPGEIRLRQSRQPTWKRNQHFVSEAFGFLKEIDSEDVGDVKDSTQISDLNLESCYLCGQPLPSEMEASENHEGQSLCRHCATKQTDSETVNAETDDIGELPDSKPGITRRRKVVQQSGTGDDDGNSSDEDKGVYRESFRKSTWLYIGDNEEIKESRNQTNYISLSDLGVNTCDSDSVFGDGDLALSPLPKLSHKRNDSTGTTLSEQEFRNKYNAVSRRIVKRADSQQEYKRFTAKSFDNMKSFVIERDSSTEFGIHVLDSKPAVISGIDAGSAAESAGLKEGQILISVNGVNVLEADHSEIIGLVTRDSKTLTVEVGSGDTSTILDLQVPVMTGYLQKQVSSTIFRTWKKRYFILRRDNCLYYYKNEAEADPLGAIPLNGYNVSRHGDLNKFGFKAEKYNHKTFYFLAESREQMTNWVGALNDGAQKGKSKDSWMDVTAHNVGLPALNIRNPDCSGYLFKMGRATRRWRKRYCVLKDACIYYYRNANSKEADGVAHLHGYSVEASCVSGKKFSFSLRPPEPQMRTFCFYTDNDTDKLRWVRSLNTSIKKWVKVD